MDWIFKNIFIRNRGVQMGKSTYAMEGGRRKRTYAFAGDEGSILPF